MKRYVHIDGKYTFIINPAEYGVKCLRYGEDWFTFEKGSDALLLLLSMFKDQAEALNRIQYYRKSNDHETDYESLLTIMAIADINAIIVPQAGDHND